MSNCPACGTKDAYNSGFTVECTNSCCRFFSATHCQALTGATAASGFEYTETSRLLKVSTPSKVEVLRISSLTTPVSCEMCYMLDSSSFSLARWVGDRSLECMVAGNSFNATIEAVDQSIAHKVSVELLNEKGVKLYAKTVDFGLYQHLKFEIMSGS